MADFSPAPIVLSQTTITIPSQVFVIQPNVETTIGAFLLSGGTLGNNGMLKVEIYLRSDKSSTNRWPVKIYLGGVLLVSSSPSISPDEEGIRFFLENQGSQQSQKCSVETYNLTDYDTNSAAVDTAEDRTLTITVTPQFSDTVYLRGIFAELTQGP